MGDTWVPVRSKKPQRKNVKKRSGEVRIMEVFKEDSVIRDGVRTHQQGEEEIVHPKSGK